ncbi:MAG: hypothetical protein MJK04_08705, partial [Psychrosphaera sp.]|nr:hypothetical protein [Psychrosphaera sp.]
DFQFNMVRDFEFIKHELGACISVEPQPHEEDGPDVTHPPIETVMSTHYKVDIKVVHWIPFRTNDVPLPNQFLPNAWKNTPMSQEVRMATRLMLSTGNAPPPDSFTNEAAWDTFLTSKEYRSVFWAQLYICCPSGDPKTAVVKVHKTGYTPCPSDVAQAPANTLAKRLKDHHDRRQTPGSTVEGIMAGNGAVGQSTDVFLGFPWVQQLPVPDQIDDPLELLRKKYKGTTPAPESHSKGKAFDGSRNTSSKDCVSGVWSHFFRVGDSHNLLNYMLVGSLVPYQGGDLQFSLCCSNQQLKLTYNHTTVPSFKVYVNNELEGRPYDMLSSKFSSMNASVSGDPLKTLGRPARPKMPATNIWQTVVDLQGESGCEPIPDNWWPSQTI